MWWKKHNSHSELNGPEFGRASLADNSKCFWFSSYLCCLPTKICLIKPTRNSKWVPWVIDIEYKWIFRLNFFLSILLSVFKWKRLTFQEHFPLTLFALPHSVKTQNKMWSITLSLIYRNLSLECDLKYKISTAIYLINIQSQIGYIINDIVYSRQILFDIWTFYCNSIQSNSISIITMGLIWSIESFLIFVLRFLILLVEFGDEFQIGSLQILCNPLVDASVQIRTEVVLPVARLSFADERMSFIGESRFDLHRHVDWCVFRKIINFDVID